MKSSDQSLPGIDEREKRCETVRDAKAATQKSMGHI